MDRRRGFAAPTERKQNAEHDFSNNSPTDRAASTDEADSTDHPRLLRFACAKQQ